MKKILFTIALFVYAQFSDAQTNLGSLNLFGKVKKIEECAYRYVEKFGEFEVGDSLGREFMEFNDKGYLIKKYMVNDKSFEKNKFEIYTYVYTNNERGQFKEINVFYAVGAVFGYGVSKSDSTLYSKTKFKYNETGDLVQKIIYNGNGDFWVGYDYGIENGKIEEYLIDEYGRGGSSGSDRVYGNTGRNPEGFLRKEEIENFLYGEEVNEINLKNEDKVDVKGNWIKRIQSINKYGTFKQLYGYERKIIYF
jgi:hypothetical protein